MRPEDSRVDATTIISTLLGIVTAFVVWWVRNIWTMVLGQQLQITALHLKLVENYVPRGELQEMFTRIFTKLDEIQRDVKK